MDIQQLKTEVMQGIYENRMLLTSERDRPEGWRLISGIWSPFYIQLRLISSFPDTLSKAAKAMTMLLKEEAPHVNKIVGIAFAGVSIATAVSLESNLPASHTRKIAGVKSVDDLNKVLEEYGQHALVEGVLEDGDNICLIDDLVTGMTSKITAREQVLAEVKRRGLSDVKCDDIAVIIDRQQGARKKATELGLSLHSLIDLADEGLMMIKDMMSEQEYFLITDYLQDPTKYLDQVQKKANVV